MIAIKNGRIVLPDRIAEGMYLLIEGDHIHSLSKTMPQDTERVIDAHGRYVTPGFIDIHSDRIEQFILPRPTARFDNELALKECERELMLQGVTTMYHSLSLYKDDRFGKSPLRNLDSVQKMAELIRGVHERNHLIHHRLHLRLEIDYLEAYDIAREMIRQGLIHEISFMDHSPGQGQYRNLAVYREVLAKYKDCTPEEYDFEEFLAREKVKKTLSMEQLRDLCCMAHEHGIAVASHDDDTVEKLRINREIGVDISEFPINLEAAGEAKNLGFATVIGAPNILRGGSHSGNMSAADAILADCGDILCSDYYPAAILHSIFIMNQKYGVPLTQMVNRASLNPAKAVGIDSRYGSIEPGKQADLLIIDQLDGYPVITHVLVNGTVTARVEYRR